MVLVQKDNRKWRMCKDFTNLNKACQIDVYSLSTINSLVDGVARCELLRFMDAYSGYNQIRMHLEDEEKIAFMGGLTNYCYTGMPFGLKKCWSDVSTFDGSNSEGDDWTECESLCR